MKALSIFYDKNEKKEYIFDYFNKKGGFSLNKIRKNIIFNLEKANTFKEISEILIDDSKQIQTLLQQITENQVFSHEVNNFSVFGITFYLNEEKFSEINFVCIPFHYILVQVFFLLFLRTNIL